MKYFLLASFVLLIGGGTGVFLLISKPELKIKKIPPQSPVPSQVIIVEPKTHSLIVRSQGVVSAKHTIDLIAETLGVIEKVSPTFMDGGHFSVGETLVEIESLPYQAALFQAKARVAMAKELLATIRGQARRAEKDWRDLGDRDANDLFLKRPQIESAKSQVDAAVKEMQKAVSDLNKTKMTMPYAGRIVQKYVDQGQFVSMGKRLATLYASSVLLLKLSLSHQQLEHLGVGLNAKDLQIPVDLTGEVGGKTAHWIGKLTHFEAAVNEKTRLINGIVEIDNSQKNPLIVGQYLHAAIKGKNVVNALKLPRQALRVRNKIWIVTQQKLQIISVAVIARDKEQVLIEAPMKTSFSVVTTPIVKPVEGMLLDVSEIR